VTGRFRQGGGTPPGTKERERATAWQVFSSQPKSKNAQKLPVSWGLRAKTLTKRSVSFVCGAAGLLRGGEDGFSADSQWQPYIFEQNKPGSWPGRAISSGVPVRGAIFRPGPGIYWKTNLDRGNTKHSGESDVICEIWQGFQHKRGMRRFAALIVRGEKCGFLKGSNFSCWAARATGKHARCWGRHTRAEDIFASSWEQFVPRKGGGRTSGLSWFPRLCQRQLEYIGGERPGFHLGKWHQESFPNVQIHEIRFRCPE